MIASVGSVCAVVVTFNRKDMLRANLRGLLAQERQVDTILVVDNHSTDGTVQMVRTEFPTVALLKLPANVGGAGGFHSGMHWGYERGFEWIWCMDDDSIPQATCLAELLNATARLAPGPLVVCPQIIHHSTGIPQLYHHKRISHRFVDHPISERELSLDLIRIDANGFVGPLINREGIHVHGLPIAEYFYQADDLEYTYRFGMLGQCYLVPSARIHHDDKVGPSSSKKLYYWRRNYVHFIRKHRSVTALGGIALTLVLLREGLISLRYTVALIRGCFRGNRGNVLEPLRGYVHGLRLPTNLGETVDGQNRRTRA